jgi:hypothetical protein
MTSLVQNNSSVWIKVPIDPKFNKFNQPFYLYNKVTNDVCFSLQDQYQKVTSKEEDDDEDDEEDETSR